MLILLNLNGFLMHRRDDMIVFARDSNKFKNKNKIFDREIENEILYEDK